MISILEEEVNCSYQAVRYNRRHQSSPRGHIEDHYQVGISLPAFSVSTWFFDDELSLAIVCCRNIAMAGFSCGPALHFDSTRLSGNITQWPAVCRKIAGTEAGEKAGYVASLLHEQSAFGQQVCSDLLDMASQPLE